jgi:hypothetical protein
MVISGYTHAVTLDAISVSHGTIVNVVFITSIPFFAITLFCMLDHHDMVAVTDNRSLAI